MACYNTLHQFGLETLRTMGEEDIWPLQLSPVAESQRLEKRKRQYYRFCKTDTRYTVIGIGASPGLQSASSAWVVVSSGPCPCSTFINMPWTNAQRQPAGLQKRCVHSSSTARVFHSTVHTGTKMSSDARPPAREIDPLLALLVWPS